MTAITNAEHVLLLLRSHLQRTQRTAGKTAKGRTERAQTSANAVDRVQQIAAQTQLSDEEIKRALVAGLLAEEFGSVIASNPKFQGVVDDVLRVIKTDPASQSILDQSVAQLLGKT